MIAVFALMLQTAAPAPAALPASAMIPDHARRGVLVRLDGAAAQSREACISACALNDQCQAWTFRPAQTVRPGRCDLHPIAGPSQFAPGAITGLSPSLAARIEAGAERAPSPRERTALSGQPPDRAGASEARGELAGGG